MQKQPSDLSRNVKLSLATGLGCLLLSMAGVAQQLQVPSLPTGLPSALPSAPLPTSPSTTSAADDDKNGATSNKDENSASQSSTGVLTAAQIIAVVQERPELIVDLKQVMADYLEQQGHPVQVDSITDDMLYKGINTDPGLRGAISIWLRARGYLPDADSNISELDTKSLNALADGTGAASSTSGNPFKSEDTADPIQNNSSTSNRVTERERPEGRDKYSAVKADRNNPSTVEVVRQTAPYNLQSLRDLYTQVPEQTSNLKRFGSDMFLGRGPTTRQMPVDIPVSSS